MTTLEPFTNYSILVTVSGKDVNNAPFDMEILERTNTTGELYVYCNCSTVGPPISCVCVCVCVCVYVYVCVHVHVHMCTCVYMCIVCAHVCVHMCTCMCIYVYVYLCTCVYVWVCCVCAHVGVYVNWLCIPELLICMQLTLAMNLLA